MKENFKVKTSRTIKTGTQIIPEEVILKSIDENREYPLLMNFDQNKLIGSAKIKIEDDHLLITGEINDPDLLKSIENIPIEIKPMGELHHGVVEKETIIDRVSIDVLSLSFIRKCEQEKDNLKEFNVFDKWFTFSDELLNRYFVKDSTGYHPKFASDSLTWTEFAEELKNSFRDFFNVIMNSKLIIPLEEKTRELANCVDQLEENAAAIDRLKEDIMKRMER